MKSAKKVLEETRQLVENTHWIKATYYVTTEDGKPKYCLIGMLNHHEGRRLTTTSLEIQDSKAKRCIEWAIGEVNPRWRGTIEAWNDRDKTTRKKVLEMLDVAIKLATTVLREPRK